MAALLLFFILSSLSLIAFSSLISSEIFSSLKQGSSLTTRDVLVSSPQAIFTAGFFGVGENAYIFAIWYTQPYEYDGSFTTVWMANRDQPVNGEETALFLESSGNLILIDAGQHTVWTTNTISNSSLQLQLHDSGNLLLTTSEGENLWQSFDFPTNTLLPQQLFTKNTVLVSSRSQTNHSSGFYKLYFYGDSILYLRYEGPEITSVYWPNSWIPVWSAGRSTFNSSRSAVLNSSGSFQTSDQSVFRTSDYGVGPHRRLVLDVDGDLRVYSLDKQSRSWQVTWQHSSEPCTIHGICGPNSLCVNDPQTGRKCTCLPGHRIRNLSDWSSGCEPEFHLSCTNSSASGFIQLLNVEFYGFDFTFFPNYSLESCKSMCLKNCDCKGFQYRFNENYGFYDCYLKNSLFNGYRSLNFPDPVFLRLPRENLTKYPNPAQDFILQCTDQITPLKRIYQRKKNGTVKTFALCTLAIGVIEIVCLLTYLLKTRKGSNPRTQGYLLTNGFREFSYAELKKASKNFSEEIGRGGDSVVYKGVLSDDRVAAIKYLKKAIQCEATLLAEISTIGRLNHMNLIEIWGYCAEGDRRLLVYQYMEHGSLAKNLRDDDKLDWKKRYEIALGTAKGLAYLHEECLEWVLHCDVKPQNILLDSDYQPKVADFGLSKILKRSGAENSSFSRIRGTRGYMAPEWVFNLPITSKVDVYSYGIVVLELITGKTPTGGYASDDSRAVEPKTLVGWVKEKMQEAEGRASPSPLTKIVEASLKGQFEMEIMEILVKVALQCTEEDEDARPSMRQVVDTLLFDQRSR